MSLNRIFYLSLFSLVAITLFASNVVWAEEQSSSSAANEEIKQQVSEYEKYVNEVKEFESSEFYDGSILSETQESEIVIGDINAPVRIIEYASLSCGHCKHFHETVYYDLKKNYIDTGKASLIFRHYPLNAAALKGAVLVNCASEENRLKFIGALFKGQNKWAFSASEAGVIEKLRTLAIIGGLSGDSFTQCYENTEIEKAILADMKKATDSLGVKSTPAIFINDSRYLGARSYDSISKFIDELLKVKQ